MGSGRLADPVVVVLEGKARSGVQADVVDGVKVLHAAGSGDDMLIDVISDASDQVTLVTADRGLRERAEALGAWVRTQFSERKPPFDRSHLSTSGVSAALRRFCAEVKLSPESASGY
jgi:hypothetical protein